MSRLKIILSCGRNKKVKMKDCGREDIGEQWYGHLVVGNIHS